MRIYWLLAGEEWNKMEQEMKLAILDNFHVVVAIYENSFGIPLDKHII